jgi:hypothetical protein
VIKYNTVQIYARIKTENEIIPFILTFQSPTSIRILLLVIMLTKEEQLINISLMQSIDSLLCLQWES